MPSNQNTTQNPIPEENTQPVSPQEPMADAPIPATDSVPTELPPEAPEAPRNDFGVKSKICHLLILPLQSKKKS
jgi:hypothetical protein